MSFADDMEARLHAFAIGCVRFVRTLPATDDGREWGGQLRRASTASSAIYRASRRGKSKADWLDKIADTVEELDECECWFSVIEEADLAVPLQELRSEGRQLRAILAKSLATGRANERRRKEQRGRKRKPTTPPRPDREQDGAEGS
jgi:four helix bundle protein